MNLARIRQLIGRSIRNFSLNLSGLTVLTEAASGYYALTPLIAALAEADCVLALTKDSRFGRADDVQARTMELAQNWDVDHKIEIIFDRNDNRIGRADIITNLGFVRPIDANFLNGVNETAVIPLMWETWEYRPADLDLEACRRLQIPVLGTNEHHPDLRLFEYIGYIALKLLFEAGIEILDSKIAVLGTGKFAVQVLATLKAANARVHHISSLDDSDIKSDPTRNFLKRADALITVEHNNRNQLIGEQGLITADALCSLNEAITVIHLCGAVDQQNLLRNGIMCWPRHFAPAGYMSVATDYVGPAPLIKLHTAGLKVGESLARARRQGSGAFDSEMEVLAKLELAQGFEGYHDG